MTRVRRTLKLHLYFVRYKKNDKVYKHHLTFRNLPSDEYLNTKIEKEFGDDIEVLSTEYCGYDRVVFEISEHDFLKYAEIVEL